MPSWTKFDASVIEKTHGNIFYYRSLYEGKHSEIFPRAKELIAKGEIIDNIMYGTERAKNVQTPYLVANICKLIPEIPAMLVSRSIGNIQSSLSPDDFQTENINQETDELVDEPRDEVSRIIHVQQEIINQIQKNSNLAFEHWGNILQQQVDGGLVGVPWNDELGLRLEFKARDVYYPHDNGLGVDLAYEIEIDDEEYLHVYREEVKDGDLHTKHMLYILNEQRKTEEVPEDEAKKLLDMKELEKVYLGRGRPFVIYWPNEKTFMNPLGTSCLKGQDGKQDEINWTLTRNAITFERNGKPRIAVSKEVMQALMEKAHERYGDESKIDHRDLEVTTFDDQGKALEVIQIDITKIGDIQWVKDLMKLMLMETKTSEKVVDFYMDKTTATGAQSGVAKFYDLFTSLIKAEQIQSEYIYFLQQLIESALWLANYNDDAVVIEEPEIMLKSMIPISRKELIEENKMAFEGANDIPTQSLETTLRRNNPNASEEWIREEIARIEAEKSGDDSFSLMNGRQTLQQFMGNRDADGNPVQDDE
ncbi:hypothetical protein [Oceanobacillus profundus]|uniref:Phage portal protein n=1 Tax=Oceanobacillus profundus TaxID=372463 RepID=A0A417YJZ1_9BACI|nr:hypothetical protein [Oceanobacillus profundus]RHW33529.1 hypothetical protein D1B32_05660 [Oceanobacillus profundus]